MGIPSIPSDKYGKATRETATEGFTHAFAFGLAGAEGTARRAQRMGQQAVLIGTAALTMGPEVNKPSDIALQGAELIERSANAWFEEARDYLQLLMMAQWEVRYWTTRWVDSIAQDLDQFDQAG